MSRRLYHAMVQWQAFVGCTGQTSAMELKTPLEKPSEGIDLEIFDAPVFIDIFLDIYSFMRR